MAGQMTEMLKGTLEGIVLAILAERPAYGTFRRTRVSSMRECRIFFAMVRGVGRLPPHPAGGRRCPPAPDPPRPPAPHPRTDGGRASPGPDPPRIEPNPPVRLA